MSEAITTRLGGSGTWASTRSLAVREGVQGVRRGSAEGAANFTGRTGDLERKRDQGLLISVALSFVKELIEKGQKAWASPEEGRGYLNKTYKAEYL